MKHKHVHLSTSKWDLYWWLQIEQRSRQRKKDLYKQTRQWRHGMYSPAACRRRRLRSFLPTTRADAGTTSSSFAIRENDVAPDDWTSAFRTALKHRVPWKVAQTASNLSRCRNRAYKKNAKCVGTGRSDLCPGHLQSVMKSASAKRVGEYVCQDLYTITIR